MTPEQKQLVQDNMKLAYHFVSKYGKSYNIELEDKLQTALYGLCKAADSYDSSKGFAFSTYAYVCIRNQFLKLNRKTRIEDDPNLLHIEQPIYDSGDELYLGNTIPSDISVIDEVVCKDQIKYAFEKLNPRDRDIVSFVVNNPELNKLKCAEALGMSRYKVDKAISSFMAYYRSD